MNRTHYRGTDDAGVWHRIPRRVDVAKDGTRLAAAFPAVFDLKTLTPMTPRAFEVMLEREVPDQVLERFMQVIEEAEALWREGKADRPPARAPWRRGMVLTWVHSRDMTVIMSAMGSPKRLTGVHDLLETAKGRRVKASLRDVDPWYRQWAAGLGDDEDVVIGYLNPHLAASFYNRGQDRAGALNASNAHLLSDHHLGTPEKPVDLIEKAVNWVTHQLPREHYGVHHDPCNLGTYSTNAWPRTPPPRTPRSCE